MRQINDVVFDKQKLTGCVVLHTTHEKNMMPIIAVIGILVVLFNVDTARVSTLSIPFSEPQSM
jgi:biotin-(acetyl-CoA carboxylase) ligase